MHKQNVQMVYKECHNLVSVTQLCHLNMYVVKC